jgi:hypothetical protein
MKEIKDLINNIDPYYTFICPKCGNINCSHNTTKQCIKCGTDYIQTDVPREELGSKIHLRDPSNNEYDEATAKLRERYVAETIDMELYEKNMRQMEKIWQCASWFS